MPTDDQLDSALRSLDPADQVVDPLGKRAADDLEKILATNPNADSTTAAPRRRLTRQPALRPARRLAVTGAAAAAMALGLVAIPALTTDDEDAFASWAAVPEQLAPQQRPEAADKCRANWQNGPEISPWGVTSEDLDSAHVAVAEKRGSWTTVVLAGDDGLTATCTWGQRGPASAWLGTRDVMPLDPRAIQPFSIGGSSQGSQGDLSTIVGYSGDDVVGVRYHSERYGDVVATVGEERFALWMPGDELHGDARTDGVDVKVTYADGATESVRLSPGR